MVRMISTMKGGTDFCGDTDTCGMNAWYADAGNDNGPDVISFIRCFPKGLLQYHSRVNHDCMWLYVLFGLLEWVR